MKVVSCETWDEAFFQDWVRFRNGIYQRDADFLPESLDNFSLLLSDPNVFPMERWVALSLYTKQGLTARALVAVSRFRPNIAKVGFIESAEDPLGFHFFWDEVEKTARDLGANEIKAPVDLHFFVSYRWKLWGEGKPFYGEPNQKSYYPELLTSVGMSVSRSWETFSIDIWRSSRQFSLIRKAKKPEHQLRVRRIDMRRFDEEMKTIHQLFIETYQGMPEFEPIPFASFKKIYANFRYIVSPYFAFIIEHAGQPVAFSVNFMDPQHVLKEFYTLKKVLPEALVNLWLWIRIKTNFRRLLCMYVGSLPAPGGKQFKGLQSLVFRKIFWLTALTRPKFYICYTAEDSPALKSYTEDQKEIRAKYAVFKKAI